MFEVGDKVVHPHHGAGVVTRRETRVVLGEEREYLTIHIPLTDLVLNVPADGAEAVGVRRVIGESVLDDLARTLTAGDIELEGNWNRRLCGAAHDHRALRAWLTVNSGSGGR